MGLVHDNVYLVYTRREMLKRVLWGIFALWFGVFLSLFSFLNTPLGGVAYAQTQCSQQIFTDAANQLEGEIATDIASLKEITDEVAKSTKRNEIGTKIGTIMTSLRACYDDPNVGQEAQAMGLELQDLRNSLDSGGSTIYIPLVGYFDIGTFVSGSLDDTVRAVRAIGESIATGSPVPLGTFFGEQLIKTLNPALTEKINSCEKFDYAQSIIGSYLRPICALLVVLNDGLLKAFASVVKNIQEVFKLFLEGSGGSIDSGGNTGGGGNTTPPPAGAPVDLPPGIDLPSA